MEEFADDNFKFDENGRKLSKQVENTVGKGEIACYEQFLLFPQCFQKACFPGASKGVVVWEWVNSLPKGKILDRSKLKAFADKIIIRCLGEGRKHLGKKRKCWLPAFSSGFTMFSKVFSFRVIKNHDCVVKS